jgi:hypothetical protein
MSKFIYRTLTCIKYVSTFKYCIYISKHTHSCTALHWELLKYSKPYPIVHSKINFPPRRRLTVFETWPSERRTLGEEPRYMLICTHNSTAYHQCGNITNTVDESTLTWYCRETKDFGSVSLEWGLLATTDIFYQNNTQTDDVNTP